MIAGEPRVRRRGFFLFNSEVSEPDTGEHENPEGFVVRAPGTHHSASRPTASATPRPVGAGPSGGGSEPPVGSRSRTDDSSTSD
jgi:hypothetical protein